MVKQLFALFLLATTALHAADGIAEIKKYRFDSGAGKQVYASTFDGENDFPARMPKGYSMTPGAGRNGTGALQYARSDAKAYAMLQFDLPKVDETKTYEAEVFVRGENIRRHGDDKNLGLLCIEYLQNGKWHSGYYYKVETVGADWTRITLPVTPKPNTEMVLKLYMRRGFTGKLFFDDLVFRTSGSADSIVLNYPKMLHFKAGEDSVVLSTAPSVPAGTKLLLAVRNNGKVRDYLLSGKDHRYQAKIGPLTTGDLILDVAAADVATRRILVREQFKLRVGHAESIPPAACVIDAFSRPLIDGKPFMPIGIYGFADEKTLKTVADAGFNSLLTYGSMQMHGGKATGDRVRDIRAGLDLFAKHKIKCIFSVKDQFDHKKSAVRDNGKSPTENALHIVRNIKDHPALLAWYINDEEPRPRVPAVAELRRQISAVDPHHPTWSLTYRNGDFPYYGISGDLMGIDPYPVDRNFKSIRSIVDAMKAANGTRQTVWMVPQIFNWEVYRTKDPKVFQSGRFPTEGEIRAMPLLGALYGAKGFVFYSYFDIRNRAEKLEPGSFNREWPKVKNAVALLKKLEPYIMGKAKTHFLKVTSAPKSGEVVAGTFTADNGKRAIVIVNIEPEADATITVPAGDYVSLNGIAGKVNATTWRFRSGGIDADVLMER